MPSSGMIGRLFWVLLVGIVQITFCDDAGVIGTPDENQPPRECWVYNHMNKSGGKTIKHMLRSWVERSPPSVEGLYDSPQWISGGSFAKEYLHSNATITMGGYTEGLRPFGDQGCQWFTVFRHPVSRVVSAYFYCQKTPGDQLCGKHILDPTSTDLLTFAKHWGNYGIRQFLLAFVLPEDVVASKVGSDIRICSDFSPAGLTRNACPAWYRLKLFVERQTCASSTAHPGLQVNLEGAGSACESGPGALRESWVMQFLQPIEEILNRKYTAVGLLEQWETTLLLFNATLGIPDFDWPAAFASNGRTNAYSAPKFNDRLTHEDVKAKMLREAWVDPELKAVLWLDILLYDHAVGVFKQQAEEHGLL
ncbi:unnamed protein product [Hapterophycus canaliculatus]